MPAPNQHTSTQHSPVAAGRPAAPVLALRVLTVATVVVLGWQFATAAGLFTGGGAGPHGAGAVVLHVVTGLTALAAGWLGGVRGGPWWPAVLAAAAFGFTFVQAAFGEISGLVVHLPGAMALTVAAVWLTAWSFLRVR